MDRRSSPAETSGGLPAADPRLIGRRIRRFYEQHPFPTYEATDSPESLRRKARHGRFAALLDRQIPYDALILDVGCGTGQLPIFLSLAERRTVGVDFSFSSLREGKKFVGRFSLKNVDLIQMDLFWLGFREASFDYVISTGVLHHTGDPYAAFQGLCRLVKPGGYLLIGLYNRYARIPLILRRQIFRLMGGRFEGLDPVLRGDGEEGRKHIWFMDQYANPHESVHRVDEVMRWFTANRIDCVGVIPRLPPRPAVSPAERLFQPVSMGSRVSRVVGQLMWMFSIGREGGLFVMIGRRSGKA